MKKKKQHEEAKLNYLITVIYSSSSKIAKIVVVDLGCYQPFVAFPVSSNILGNVSFHTVDPFVKDFPHLKQENSHSFCNKMWVQI